MSITMQGSIDGGSANNPDGVTFTHHGSWTSLAITDQGLHETIVISGSHERWIWLAAQIIKHADQTDPDLTALFLRLVWDGGKQPVHS